MIKPTLAALLETLVSIEMADETVIRLDFSVSLMEQAAHLLSGLPASERQEFVETATELALQCSDAKRATLLRSTPEMLGVIPPASR